MKTIASHLIPSAVFLALTPLGCNIDLDADDNDDDDMEEPGETPDEESRFYEVENLVSDQEGMAPHVDSHLVNAWGLAFGPETFFWVANAGTSTATLYDGDGVIHNADIGGAVKLPVLATEGEEEEGGPTGQVFYGGDGFAVEDGAPSRFLFATLEGTIIGWSPHAADPQVGVIMVDNSADGAVYTGLAIAEQDDKTWIYAANFAGGSIDVYDESFTPVDLAERAFVDDDLPADYAPFNVQEIDGVLYVMYAVVDPATGEEKMGRGRGIVSAYERDGTFIDRVATGEDLDAPWGIAMAPSEFGEFGGALLVGNFGDGHITAFDATTYESLGQLAEAEGEPVAIPGLWALAFGNGLMAGDEDDLYFTAGPDDERHGLFGEIAPAGGEEDGDGDDDGY